MPGLLGYAAPYLAQGLGDTVKRVSEISTSMQAKIAEMLAGQHLEDARFQRQGAYDDAKQAKTDARGAEKSGEMKGLMLGTPDKTAPHSYDRFDATDTIEGGQNITEKGREGLAGKPIKEVATGLLGSKHWSNEGVKLLDDAMRQENEIAKLDSRAELEAKRDELRTRLETIKEEGRDKRHRGDMDMQQRRIEAMLEAVDKRIATSEGKSKPSESRQLVNDGVKQLALAHGARMDQFGMVDAETIKDSAKYRRDVAEVERRVKAGESPMDAVNQIMRGTAKEMAVEEARPMNRPSSVDLFRQKFKY